MIKYASTKGKLTHFVLQQPTQVDFALLGQVMAKIDSLAVQQVIEGLYESGIQTQDYVLVPLEECSKTSDRLTELFSVVQSDEVDELVGTFFNEGLVPFINLIMQIKNLRLRYL